MTIYINTDNGLFQSFPIPSGDSWREATEQELQDLSAALRKNENLIRESEWQAQEMLVIEDQRMAIEEEDPEALPGTDKEWLQYRTKVRKWIEGAEGYPEMTRRPVRPS
ncbi:hypothetical protein CCU68_18880 [Pseudomonas gingeri NCPPB 3146 = LMG 5327]|uniref:Virus tail fibre assembly protein, lambda gpK n=2 Tax=Pseudomonas gingeri TaxID=117681 RepID=A0A7Y8CDI4_9PSED|nr:hypothetical protein [Pseudomonas gingeri]NWC14879.1 hypothetical protein [Pseudomonas gingeri]PNQ91042.1 hypothetical protein CCU68_18880 [Pseudomonas gingeri NCPPB 3146 = LMG 5327]